LGPFSILAIREEKQKMSVCSVLSDGEKSTSLTRSKLFEPLATEGEPVICGVNLPCLDGFRTKPSVKLETLTKWTIASKGCSTEEVGVLLYYFALNTAEQLTLLEFKSRNLPILSSEREYTRAYNEAVLIRLKSTHSRVEAASGEVQGLIISRGKLVAEELSLWNQITAINSAIDMDNNSVKKSATKLKSLHMSLEKVVTDLRETKRSICDYEKLHAELLKEISTEVEKVRDQAFLHWEREQMALSRAKQAVNDFFSIMEAIVGQYPIILALLSKSQSDPSKLSDDPVDHFKKRHLHMFFLVLEMRFLNVEDDLSSMTDFLRAANPQRVFANETEVVNFYLGVVRVLKSKGVVNVPVENIMAVHIILHLIPAQRAEFLRKRQLKRELKDGSNGSICGSVSIEEEGSWMEQIIHHLDQQEIVKQQEEALISAGKSHEVPTRVLAEHVKAEIGRREEAEVRRSHQHVFSAGLSRDNTEDPNTHWTRAIKSPCRDFQRGRCAYGEECKYSHVTAAINSDSQGMQVERIPAPNADGRIPRYRMWDAAGKMCCYQSPFFIETSEGPCQNTISCQYSHKKPIYTSKPDFAQLGQFVQRS